MTALLGWGLIGAGLVVLAVAGLGLLRLPDALSRQHGTTKAGTLGLAFMLAGTALAAGRAEWWPELLVLAVVLLLTLPVAGHALARLALAEKDGGSARDDGQAAPDQEPSQQQDIAA